MVPAVEGEGKPVEGAAEEEGVAAADGGIDDAVEGVFVNGGVAVDAGFEGSQAYGVEVGGGGGLLVDEAVDDVIGVGEEECVAGGVVCHAVVDGGEPVAAPGDEGGCFATLTGGAGQDEAELVGLVQ